MTTETEINALYKTWWKEAVAEHGEPLPPDVVQEIQERHRLEWVTWTKGRVPEVTKPEVPEVEVGAEPVKAVPVKKAIAKKTPTKRAAKKQPAQRPIPGLDTKPKRAKKATKKVKKAPTRRKAK